jgi:hypothetical protein
MDIKGVIDLLNNAPVLFPAKLRNFPPLFRVTPVLLFHALAPSFTKNAAKKYDVLITLNGPILLLSKEKASRAAGQRKILKCAYVH